MLPKYDEYSKQFRRVKFSEADHYLKDSYFIPRRGLRFLPGVQELYRLAIASGFLVLFVDLINAQRCVGLD